MTDKQPEALIRADELEAIGAESSLARAMAAHTIRLLYKENEALRARLAQPEPEVGVCCQEFDKCLRSCTPRGQWIAHNAAQREWQGLTDEEIAVCIQMGESGSLDGFIKPLATYRAIEAKLKEKNHGN
jgi:hypothetical protein